tara:strand:+ start:516 stop:656 length:141 start_codon:yes stop_codon:yes gene_type:complete
MDLSDFNKDKQNFDHVSKDEQKVIVGKLHMLETLVDIDLSDSFKVV